MRRAITVSLLAAVAASAPAVYAQSTVTIAAAPSPAAGDCVSPGQSASQLSGPADWCVARSGFESVHTAPKRAAFGEKHGTFAAFMHGLGLEANEVVYTQTSRSPALGQAGDAKATADEPSILPEPATWIMLLLGFGAFGALLRRKFRQSEQRFNDRIRRIEAGEPR